jgi:hypothetical protein
MFRMPVRLFSTSAPSARIIQMLSKNTVQWNRTANAVFPWEANVNNVVLRMRINNYPEQPLYTVMRDAEELMNVNGFRSNWNKATPNANTP